MGAGEANGDENSAGAESGTGAEERRNAYGFLDFFAGIGLFRLGLEQAGFRCRGHCEIDKYANLSYNAMHQPKGDEWFGKDITKISADSLPDVDLWAAGFPCQNLSAAGNREGLHGERSGLFFELVRLLRERGDHLPRWVVLEAQSIKILFESTMDRILGRKGICYADTLFSEIPF